MSKPLINWTEKDEFGIPIIDEQHRGLITLINSLHFYIQNHARSFIIESTIDMIDRYIKLHGYTEEYLFQKYHYPEFEKHQAEHIRIINDLSLGRNKDLHDPKKYLNRLKEWFVKHTENEDRKYLEFIKQAIEEEKELKKKNK